MKRFLGILIVITIILSNSPKIAEAGSPNLDVRIYKGVVLFTVTGMKNTKVTYTPKRMENMFV